MTAPADRWVRSTDWARIAGLLGLAPAAMPAEVIAELEQRSGKDTTHLDRETRSAAIEACRRCDPQGWRLGLDGQSADLARRCDHRLPAEAPRDLTAPLYERNTQ